MVQIEQAFYEIEDFPELQNLSEKWEIIKKEFLELKAPVMDVHRIDKVHEDVFTEVHNQVLAGKQYGWVQGWGAGKGGNINWIQYGLVLNGKKIPFVNNEMQNTINLLLNIDGINAAALLKLKPHTVLHTHNHPDIREKNALQMHLPLQTIDVENYNYLNVMGEFRQYQEGIPIVFDGALNHFAMNESRYNRTTLYIEFGKEKLMR